MTETHEKESNLLLDELLPFATQQLQKHGEFYPFAAVMLTNSQIQLLATYDGDNHPESQKVIDELEQSFIRGAKNNEYKATALAYMIAIRHPETKKREDAICINLDHLNNYSTKIIFPYVINKKLFRKRTIQFLPSITISGEGKIFNTP